MGWRRGLLLVALCSLLLGGAAAIGAPTPTHVRFTANGDIAQHATRSSAVLNALGAADPDAHFVLGDLSYGAVDTEQAWCNFVTSRVGDGFPFELLAGNHESDGQNGHINNFSSCLPNQLPGLVGTYGRQYYVDMPQQDPLIRYVGISPNLTFPAPDGATDYSAGSTRYNWTAAAIDDARSKDIPWVVVGMHKPCLSTGEYNCDVPKSLVDMLMTKRVDLVLSGHEHFYQRTKQLALGAGCTTLTTGSYNASCVEDGDDDLVKGAGTVFVTVGTGGQILRDIDTLDPETPYFATSMGANSNPTYGFGDYDVTPTELTGTFVRAFGGTFTDSFTITEGTTPPGDDPVAAFSSTTNGLTANLNGTASSDPDGGTIQSYGWQFGDGQSGSGATTSHPYAVAATYPVTLTVTDDEGATDSVTQDVTVTSSGVQVLASDQFERTATNAWGTADVGGPWAVTATAGVSSVSGGKGRLTLPTVGQGANANLNGVSSTDLDLSFELSLDKVPTGSGSRVDHAVLVRRTATGSYRSMVRIQANNTVRVDFLKVVGSTSTAIGSTFTIPGLTYTAADTLRVRTQATGTSPTTLRVKVWKLGTAEPAAWTRTATDSTSGLQSAGSIGFFPYLSSSATNAPVQVRYDNVQAAVASTLP